MSGASRRRAGRAEPGAPAPAGQRTLLTFFIGREEYALPLTRVHRVAALGETTRVPTAPGFVKGLVASEGSAVPVIDLAERFGASHRPEIPRRSLVMTRMEVARRVVEVAVAADGLGRLRRVPAEQVRPVPSLDSVVSLEFLTGAFQTDGGLVLCLDIDRIFGANEASRIADLAQEAGANSIQKPAVPTPYLVVTIAGERCVLGVSRVQEILQRREIVPIPGSPPHVLGVANVRGSVVAVVDPGRRHGPRGVQRGDTECLVLLEAGRRQRETLVALLVDAVEGLVRLRQEQIDRTPPFGTRFQAEVVAGMAPVGGAHLPVLDTGRMGSAHDPDAKAPHIQSESPLPLQQSGAQPS